MAQSVLGIYRCIYNFKAEAPNDLELWKGDLICVTKKISCEWLYGTAKGQFGQFPVNFVELVFDKPVLRVGIVLNDFNTEHQDDLQLFQGDIIGIERDVDANWRYGFSKLSSGIFPTNFIQEINFTSDVASIGVKDTNNNNSSSHDSAPRHGRAEVIDSFQAQDSDELSINTGQFVELTKEIDSFWIEGILNGKKGKFPRMYINIIEDLPADLKFKEKKEEKRAEPQAKALYMFVGTHPEEISFDKGDIIMLVDRLGKDWLVGKVGKTVGRFPSNYVEVLVDLPYSDKPRWSPTKPAMTKPPTITNTKPHSDSSNKTVTSQIKPNPKLKPSVSPGKPIIRQSSNPKVADSKPKPNLQSKPNLQPKPLVSPVKPTTLTKPSSSASVKTSPQPMVTKVVASNIPEIQKKRAQPGRSGSFKENINQPQKINSGKEEKSKPIPGSTNSNVSQHDPTNMDSSKPIVGNPPIVRNGSVKRTDVKRSNSLTKNTNYNNNNNSLQRKSSLSGKKRAPAAPHQFELVEEKIFDMYSKPTPVSKTNNASLEKPKINNNKPPSPNTISPPAKQNKAIPPRLPKPLAPMPAAAGLQQSSSSVTTDKNHRARPKSLSFQPSSRHNNNNNNNKLTTPSPISSINSKSFTVSYSKNQHQKFDEGDEREDEITTIMPRSETDPSLSTREHMERPSLTPDPVVNKKLTNGMTRERPKSLYFASSSGSAPSPEKRSQTLDAVLQRVWEQYYLNIYIEPTELYLLISL